MANLYQKPTFVIKNGDRHTREDCRSFLCHNTNSLVGICSLTLQRCGEAGTMSRIMETVSLGEEAENNIYVAFRAWEDSLRALDRKATGWTDTMNDLFLEETASFFYGFHDDREQDS